jgi:hypothetical protein
VSYQRVEQKDKLLLPRYMCLQSLQVFKRFRPKFQRTFKAVEESRVVPIEHDAYKQNIKYRSCLVEEQRNI